MRVLGIDTSLRSTGIGVVESSGSKLALIECGAIRVPATRPHSECLKRIQEELPARDDPMSIYLDAVEAAFSE